MTILLFATTDTKGSRADAFERLTASVAASRDAVRDLRFYVLLQNCDAAEHGRLQAAAPAWCRMLAVPGRVSASAARNGLIKIALAEAPARHDDLVAFPDDDAWLPEGLVGALAAMFDRRPELDVLLCRVSPRPDTAPFDVDAVVPLSLVQLVRTTMASNMFMRGSIMTRVGLFDPGLGVGTPAGGGEDTDYMLRAALTAGRSGFIDRALVGHPIPGNAKKATYYGSGLTVLARYARAHPALMWEFRRKILVGLYFVLRGMVPPRRYGHALREGLRTYRGTLDRVPGAVGR